MKFIFTCSSGPGLQLMLGAGTDRTKLMQLLFVSRVSSGGMIIGKQNSDSSLMPFDPESPQHSTARSCPSSVLTNEMSL